MATSAIALTIVLLVCFFGLLIGVGIYCRKTATSVNGFVLGGRKAGPWLTAFAFGTSYFSAVIFVGYAGQFGWNFGLASTWIGLGNAFIGSLLSWSLLGRRTRVITQHIGSRTMPDFFSKRYGSDKLKVVASAIVFIFLIPYTASLYNGLSSLFNIAFNIPYWVCIVVMSVLTCVFVVFGGYMATAITDFIQGIIMLGGIIAVVAALLGQLGGLNKAIELLSQVPPQYPDTINTQGAFTSFFGTQPLYLLFVILLTSLGTWGLPQMISKFYSIKNEESIKTGTIISTVFAIIIAGGSYFIGGFGRLYADRFNDNNPFGYDKIIPTMLSTLPDVVISVVIILVLSASMSTLSSLVLVSSSTLTLDFIVPLRKKETSPKMQLLVMRILIGFFVAIFAIIAIIKDLNPGVTFIAQMMGISWGALAGSFLAPFLYGLYSKKVSSASVAACFAFACGLEAVQLLIMLNVFSVNGGFLGFVFRNSLYSGVFAMLGGLVIVPVVSLFTKKQSAEEVDKIFVCYEKGVEAVSALDETE